MSLLIPLGAGNRVFCEKSHLPIMMKAVEKTMPLLLLFLSSVYTAGCNHNPNYDQSKQHHTPEGFRNNYRHVPKGNFWKWRWERFWSGLPREPKGGYSPEILKPDLNALRAKMLNPSVTWIGHSTLLLQLGGVNVLTDPHLTDRASPLDFIGPRRKVPPALTFKELPHIDIVVISHNHYDHLDRETVRRLSSQSGGSPRFFVPLGVKAWFTDLDSRDVVEQDWWEHTEHLGITVHFVPVQHWSARTRWDRNETLWGGFVLEYAGYKFFFAGDTGYSADFKDIGSRLGPIDLAAIPIGGYEPRWFMQAMHVNPEEAVKIHQDVRARYSVGIHWGTFELTDETIDEPPKALNAALTKAGIHPKRFFVMKHGETRRLKELSETGLPAS
jgi:L-ascorbate metabolism protein UlaG (beta-lactamase superfamily)